MFRAGSDKVQKYCQKQKKISSQSCLMKFKSSVKSKINKIKIRKVDNQLLSSHYQALRDSFSLTVLVTNYTLFASEDDIQVQNTIIRNGAKQNMIWKGNSIECLFSENRLLEWLAKSWPIARFTFLDESASQSLQYSQTNKQTN